MSHTPGPWYEAGDNENGNGIMARGTQGHYIALIPEQPDYVHMDQAANARLIAAAPDMRAALAHLLDMMHPHLIDLEGDMGRDLADAMQTARAALAKATGSSA